MSFGTFLLGTIIMAIGFFMVARTNQFQDWFGDLGSALGIQNASWVSWKVLGLAFLFVGFLLAFSLVQLFFALTIGQFFDFGAKP